jgi:Ankyrin repeats (many copies)
MTSTMNSSPEDPRLTRKPWRPTRAPADSPPSSWSIGIASSADCSSGPAGGRRENSGIRVRPLYQRCRRCRHHCAVRPRLARPTVQHFGCVLPLGYGPNHFWSRPDHGGADIARAKGRPGLGLRHLDPWDHDGSHGSGGNRGGSTRHRMVVAARIWCLPSHRRSNPGARGLRRIRLRSHWIATTKWAPSDKRATVMPPHSRRSGFSALHAVGSIARRGVVAAFSCGRASIAPGRPWRSRGHGGISCGGLPYSVTSWSWPLPGRSMEMTADQLSMTRRFARLWLVPLLVSTTRLASGIRTALAFPVTIKDYDYGDTEVVQLLLEAGADPSVKSKDGLTALDLARRAGHTAIARALEGGRPGH